MTPKFETLKSTDISDQDDTEAKVRRALGLTTGASGPGRPIHAARSGERFAADRSKSRFVQDGEVTVVMLRRDNGQHAADPHAATGRSPAIRLEALEKSLKGEQHARETAERSLVEAQATIRDLQTKLGHALLVRDEARANAERVETEKQALQQVLATEHVARQTSEQRLLDVIAVPRRAAPAETKSEAGTRSPAASITKPAADIKPRGRAARSEPKPVKWWIKSK